MSQFSDGLVLPCPKCNVQYRITREWCGKRITCASCGYSFSVPDTDKFDAAMAVNRRTMLAGSFRRWCARTIDLAISSSGLLIGFPLIFPSIHWFVLTTIVLPLSLLIDGVIYAMFGGTLGKWALGLTIVDQKGKPISGGEYLGRNFHIWFSGYALGIPIVQQVMMLVQSFKADSGATTYDKESKRYVLAKRMDAGQWFRAVIIFLLFFFIQCFSFGLFEDLTS